MSLNLARKWRSTNFDEIIGQDLSVRMLKNSLYLNHLFPVYLLAGQRGCGKTTTARIFAAALNCEQLENFQKNPQQQLLPCGQCYSCQCMKQGKHPDFIEMDAASNTGVDHVRNIIDACSLLPVLGKKKIYLIDEAHMLSKAAFNAFLKIMEEPPASVLFMLATTDEHKIIDTVRSRCFTVTFPAVALPALTSHLAKICEKEEINYTNEALQVVARHAGGSVRDALNVIEQVRFGHGKVTEEAVVNALGYISDEQLLELIIALCNPTDEQLIVAWVQQQEALQYQPDVVYKRLLQLVHQLVWHTLGPKNDMHAFAACKSISIDMLIKLFELFVQHEQEMLRTSSRHAYLQMLMLMVWRKLHCAVQVSQGTPSAPKVMTQQPVRTVAPQIAQKPAPVVVSPVSRMHAPATGPIAGQVDMAIICKQLVAAIPSDSEPLVHSMLMQLQPVSWDESQKVLTVSLPGHLALFVDMITDSSAIKQSLQTLVPGAKLVVQCIAGSGGEAHVPAVKPRAQSSDATTASYAQHARAVASTQSGNNQSAKNFNTAGINKQEWPITAMLLEEFSGTVQELTQESQ